MIFKKKKKIDVDSIYKEIDNLNQRFLKENEKNLKNLLTESKRYDRIES